MFNHYRYTEEFVPKLKGRFESEQENGPSRVLRLAVGIAMAGTLTGVTVSAQAAAVITSVDLVADPTEAILGAVSIDNDFKLIDIEKSLTSLGPVILRFTVEHVGGGGGNQYDLTESVLNDTGKAWTDFHYTLDGPSGVNFGSFQQSTLTSFDLEGSPASGPDALNFIGLLANGGSADATLKLNLNDPGAGNSYTFDLVQTATVPIPAAAWLFGSALAGVMGVTRRRQKA